MANAQDVLMSGGLTSAKFDTIGDGIEGVIVRIGDPFQALDFATKKPKFWNEDTEDRKPVLVVPVEIKSDADGKSYGIYIQQSTDLQKVVATAIREAGCTMMEIGAHLRVQFIGEQESELKGANAKKLYAAIYKPAPTVGQSTLMGGVQPTLNAPVAAPLAQPGPALPSTTPAPSWATQPAAPAQPVAAAPVAAPAAPGLDLANLPPGVAELMAQYAQKLASGQ